MDTFIHHRPSQHSMVRLSWNTKLMGQKTSWISSNALWLAQTDVLIKERTHTHKLVSMADEQKPQASEDKYKDTHSSQHTFNIQ